MISRMKDFKSIRNAKHIALILVSIWSVVSFGLHAQTPAPPQEKPILIMNVTAHLGTGEVIENAVVGYSEGVINLVADARLIRLDTSGYRVINGSGQHLYPGFIAPNTTLGLTEIDLVRATRDFNETGQLNPHVRAIVAYDTDSKITPTVRSNGILLAQIVPRGGRISGTSAVVQLDAWHWEDAAVAADKGIHLNWPRRFDKEGRQRDDYAEEMQVLHQFFTTARYYARQEEEEMVNLRLEAMAPLFDSASTLFIHVQKAPDIKDALHFLSKYQLKGVLVGAADAWRVLDQLKASKVPVLLHSPHSLPTYKDEDIDQPYKTAAQLHQAGILYGLMLSGSWNVRNLPFVAGTTVRFGISREAALQSITANTAQILGIYQQYGTIEEGKSATFFLSSGDALDMTTHQVTRAFIDGREIDLANHQKQLYHKYLNKYNLPAGTE